MPQRVRTIGIIGKRNRVPSGEYPKRPRANHKSFDRRVFGKQRTRPGRLITTRSTPCTPVRITQPGEVADDSEQLNQRRLEQNFQPAQSLPALRLVPHLLAPGSRELKLRTSMRRRGTR